MLRREKGEKRERKGKRTEGGKNEERKRRGTRVWRERVYAATGILVLFAQTFAGRLSLSNVLLVFRVYRRIDSATRSHASNFPRDFPGFRFVFHAAILLVLEESRIPGNWNSLGGNFDEIKTNSRLQLRHRCQNAIFLLLDLLNPGCSQLLLLYIPCQRIVDVAYN